MNLGIISIVAKKELRDLIRDRRTLLSMIVIPVLAIPLLISGISWLSVSSLSKLKEGTLDVAVVGVQHDLNLLADLREMDERFQYYEIDDHGLPADSVLLKSDASLLLEFEASLPAAFERLEEAGEDAEVPAIRLYYDSTNDEAKVGGRELRDRLISMRKERLDVWLGSKGLSPHITRPWKVLHIETAPPKKQAAEFVARFLPYMILILCIQGAMYPAMDLTAGEKERSTIETLLVNPVSRLDIILGKYTATSVMALGSALFTLGGEYIYFRWAAKSFTNGALQLHLDPAAIGVGLLLLVPMALTFSALLLAISIYARSMKEAQSYVGPMMMLVIFPSMVSMVPGLKLTVGLSFLPVFNVALLMKDALLQDYTRWGLMVLVFFVNLGYAGIALGAALRMFQREQVIFRS